jgi:2'-5' RNA ligase
MRQETQLAQTSWRVFCAVEIPESVRELVLRHISRLREAVPDAKASWNRHANLHVTLKFLGEIPPTSVKDISNAASRAVAGLAPFSVHVEHTRVFPEHGKPRVLWIGINDLSGKLVELHTRLEDEAAQAGFAREGRRFQPHLTLARLRQPRHARALVDAHQQIEFETVSITVSELLVIRSELSSEGSKYRVISQHALSVSDKV